MSKSEASYVYDDENGDYVQIVHTKNDGGRCVHTLTPVDALKFGIELIQALKKARAQTLQRKSKP